MAGRIVILGATVLMGGGLSWWATPTLADDNYPTNGRPHLSTGPGLKNVPLLPRGGAEELFAGDPTCIPLANTLQVGIDGGFTQECGDGQWVSLAYAILTGRATIESINIVHNTNTGTGDLYLMGDCGGNPDVNNILWAGCDCIQNTVGGAVWNYCLGDPLVDVPSKVWVVAVFRSAVSFDIAFDCANDGPNHAWGNFIGSGNCGDWGDLDDVEHGDACNPGGTFGGCAWVSLVTQPSPGVPECCDSPALCDGDANGDGVVDPLDAAGILARFGLDASDPANCQFDVNCDGVISPLDSGYVLARFGICRPPLECRPGCGPGPGCGDPSCPRLAAYDCCQVHS